jgi:cation transporter-like permease
LETNLNRKFEFSAELSTGLYLGGFTTIQIDSKVIQSGVLREGDKLLFCIPESISGQSLDISAKTTTSTHMGDAIVMLRRNSNGPSVCTSTTTTTPGNMVNTDRLMIY